MAFEEQYNDVYNSLEYDSFETEMNTFQNTCEWRRTT